MPESPQPVSTSDEQTAVNRIVSPELVLQGKRVWYAAAAKLLGREALLGDENRWPDIVRGVFELRRVRRAWIADADGPIVIGIDPAWMGNDMTVISARRGLRAFPMRLLAYGTVDDVVMPLLALVRFHRHDPSEKPDVALDAIGIGALVADLLRGHAEISLHEFNSSKAAIRREDYRNLRTEMLFSTVQWLKAGGSFEPDPELERDLGATVTLADRGRADAESSRAIRKRLGRNPCRGNALSLSTYVRR